MNTRRQSETKKKIERAEIKTEFIIKKITNDVINKRIASWNCYDTTAITIGQKPVITSLITYFVYIPI